MQLFHFARDQFDHVLHEVMAAQHAYQQTAPALLPLKNMEVSLLPFGMEYEQADCETEVLPFPATEGLSPDSEQWVNVSRLKRGVEDFVSSLLYICVEGSQSLKGFGEMRLVAPNKNGQKPAVVFSACDIESASLAEAAQMIDELEDMVLHGWKTYQSPECHIKTFDRDEQKKLAEHLLCCMAEAYGYSMEETEHLFAPAPDELSLVMMSGFLEMLHEGEYPHVEMPEAA